MFILFVKFQQFSLVLSEYNIYDHAHKKKIVVTPNVSEY